ncbi:Fc.00g044870.m01.CDS01 [Cosmosporella sp. VM-42]
MSVTAKRTILDSEWTFKNTKDGDDGWHPVGQVPTVVHLDLMANGLISDPFLDTNELDVEWVGESTWTYRTVFSTPDTSGGASVFLLFDGLDTFAKVKLNDVVILESDNMFLSHRVNVTDCLKPSGENAIVIDFDSALLRGRELEEQHSEHRFLGFNGEMGRLAVRKAQYHWGWDWGPVLMTAGPWKPVRLEVSSAHIEDAHVKYELFQDLSAISGAVQVETKGEFDETRLSIRFQDHLVFSGAAVTSADHANIAFTIDGPKLWYPHGYGDQALYDVSVEIVKDGIVLDTWTKKTGFRRSELVQDNDSHGQSFYFRVNNIDVFCGGSCWIPADSFLPRISAERYREWLQLMIQGNQIMTRVWGGGIYEDDGFYNACDELGILVWQDFMFACGNYPAWPSLIESVRTEAQQNVRRLRHHPSVVIYAGNNEDYQIQETYNLEYDYQNKDTESWLKGEFPARYYYEYLLPQVVSEECHTVHYWPGSPFSKGETIHNMTVGDVHQWNVWHGTQEKYQTFHKIGGRFNSEFGMEAFPISSTIQDFITDKSSLFPQSHVMDFHNKADGHERRIAAYLVENFRPQGDLESHIYLTQLSQSEALSFAYRGWRRQWGENRRCGGALVWQLNDCWPATSWAIVDFFLRKKPAFYAIARALKSVAIGVQREHHDWSVCHARPAKTSSFSIWAASSELMKTKADIEIRFVSVETGKDIKPMVLKENHTIDPNGTTLVFSGQIDNTKEEPHVLAVRLLVNGVCVSRDVDWPQPLKYLSFSDRGVKVESSLGRYTVTAQRPTKGLVFEELDGIIMSDNCIDLVPNDEVVIEVTGGEEIESPRYRYLGST